MAECHYPLMDFKINHSVVLIIKAEVIIFLLLSCLYGSKLFSWPEKMFDRTNIDLYVSEIQGVIYFSSVIWGIGYVLIRFRKIGNLACNPYLYLFFFILINSISYLWQCPVSYQKKQAIMLLCGMVFGTGVAALSSNTHKPMSSYVVNSLILLLSIGIFIPFNVGLTFKYHNQIRWCGFVDNPNDFGLLMGTGIVLAAGQMARIRKCVTNVRHWQNILKLTLYACAVIVLSLGLLESYSRGAWLGTVIALAYLSMNLKKKEALRVSWLYNNRTSLCMLVLSFTILAFWQLQSSECRLIQRIISVTNLNDFSWSNRISAYRGAMEMIADRPCLGFGWHLADNAYETLYLSPELINGQAIKMNDFLLLGLTLGMVALVCFGMYIRLSFTEKSKNLNQKSEDSIDWLKTTCRTGAIVLLVGFWFDGGLFQLPTASTFWILLELSNV